MPSLEEQNSQERRRNINISRAELDALVIRAGREGGAEALREIGMHDEEAGRDLRELRTLLTMYREVRTGVLRAVGKSITLLILGALGFAAIRRFWS